MDILNRSAANIRTTFTELTYDKFIRLVIIVGAYALLRPYMLKLSGRSQMAQHVEANDEAKAEISPNSLRGQVDIPEDSDDEGDEAAATGADWGKKARRRQREVLKMMMDAEEAKLAQEQEDEEDKDIEEFLVKE
ncbi:hypothetical protein ACHAQA_000740 [Verticillium albo-atrum]